MRMIFYRNIVGCIGRALLFSGVSGLLPLCAYAQTHADSTTTHADTVAHVQPEIIVIGDRLSSVGSRTLLPVSVLSAAEMERSGAVQIGEALVYVPGVFIRDYGGLGGLKTVSLRGSSASQTAVFIDGVKINSVQNGLTDMSVFPTSMVESVEVVRGGESALFGASAVGGAVNIRSLSPGGKRLLRVTSSAGSFGEIGLGGVLRLPVDSTMLLAGGEYRTSQGDYPFDFTEFGATRTVRRENGDFTNASGVLAWSAAPSGWNIRTHLLGRTTRRGVPGAVVQGSIESREARLEEEDALAIVHAVCGIDTALLLSVTGTGRYNTTRYRDPGAAIFGAQGIDERFRTREVGMTTSLSGIALTQSYEVQSDIAFAELLGNMFQPDVGDKASRTSLGLAIRTERAVDIADNTLIVQGATRLDVYSDAGTAASPLVAFLWRFADVPVLLRAQWSYNFRPPSFNELYYLNFGTASLRPERSLSLNTGVEWSIAEEIRVEAAVFSIDTKDRIVAIPVSPVTWSARNIEGAVSRGVELSAHLSLYSGGFQADGSYTWQESESRTDNLATDQKDLAYTPGELAALTAFVRLGVFQAGATVHYTGRRYSLDGSSREALLPSYAVAGLMASATAGIESLTFVVRLHCDNIFDARYSVVRNYPMPGRMFRLGVDMSY